MFNPGKKIRALRDKKNYSNSCVVRKKNSERNKKTINPPLQVKWSVPKGFIGLKRPAYPQLVYPYTKAITEVQPANVI
jgi:hypothetical protein